jgi:hypothetical protein
VSTLYGRAGRAGGGSRLQPLARLDDQALRVDEPAAPARAGVSGAAGRERGGRCGGGVLVKPLACEGKIRSMTGGYVQ